MAGIVARSSARTHLQSEHAIGGREINQRLKFFVEQATVRSVVNSDSKRDMIDDRIAAHIRQLALIRERVRHCRGLRGHREEKRKEKRKEKEDEK